MPRAETATHYITHGIDPALDNAAKQALREMIALIRSKSNLSKEDAYACAPSPATCASQPDRQQHKGVHAMLKKAALHG